jgi:hypothetical protein
VSHTPSWGRHGRRRAHALGTQTEPRVLTTLFASTCPLCDAPSLREQSPLVLTGDCECTACGWIHTSRLKEGVVMALAWCEGGRRARLG